MTMCVLVLHWHCWLLARLVSYLYIRVNRVKMEICKSDKISKNKT